MVEVGPDAWVGGAESEVLAECCDPILPKRKNRLEPVNLPLVAGDPRVEDGMQKRHVDDRIRELPGTVMKLGV